MITPTPPVSATDIASRNLCARAKVKGHIELNIYGLWQAKMAQFFSTIGRHLACAIQTELVVELELALIERKQYR